MAETRSSDFSAGTMASRASCWWGEGGALPDRDLRLGNPSLDRLKILWGQAIQIRSPDAEEVVPLVDDGRKLVAVGDDDLGMDLRAVGEPHEGRELLPGEGSPARAELHLIDLMPAERGPGHPINAVILERGASAS